jgi:hypothetical protein
LRRFSLFAAAGSTNLPVNARNILHLTKACHLKGREKRKECATPSDIPWIFPDGLRLAFLRSMNDRRINRAPNGAVRRGTPPLKLEGRAPCNVDSLAIMMKTPDLERL